MEIFKGQSVEGKFVRRLNRFIAEVKIQNNIEQVHVPNTGRMSELMIKDTDVLLEYHTSKHRKTQYTLKLIKYNGRWVCIDSIITNKIVYEYLENNIINEIGRIKSLKKEVKYNNSRFDLVAHTSQKTYFIEVKSVNLVENNIALFPDAPTERGTKHLNELIHAKNNGYGACVIFVVQRSDSILLKPNNKIDPKFYDSVQKAIDSGVVFKAYSCLVTNAQINITKELEIQT